MDGYFIDGATKKNPFPSHRDFAIATPRQFFQCGAFELFSDVKFYFMDGYFMDGYFMDYFMDGYFMDGATKKNPSQCRTRV